MFLPSLIFSNYSTNYSPLSVKLVLTELMELYFPCSLLRSSPFLNFFSFPCKYRPAGKLVYPATMTDSSSTRSPVGQFNAPPNTLVLTVVLLVFFFFGFFSVYFCRCFMKNVLDSWNLGQTPSPNTAGISDEDIKTGLDPSLIRSFPTFSYSRIKDFREEKYDLECAICLVEFEYQSVLRLLAACYHIFHQECIDLWLDSHTTCPVCRRNLEKSSGKSLEWAGISCGSHSIDASNEGGDDQISIYIGEDDGEEERFVADGVEHHRSHEKGEIRRFWRSNSTGHSIVRSKKAEERHSWRASCTTFAEFCRQPNKDPVFAEVSGCESSSSFKPDIDNLEP